MTGLVERHPDHDGLYFQLNIVLAEARNVVAQATTIWSQLLNKHQQSRRLLTHIDSIGTRKSTCGMDNTRNSLSAVGKYGPPIASEALTTIEAKVEGGRTAVPGHTKQCLKAVGMHI